jgi:hypothetical protein
VHILDEAKYILHPYDMQRQNSTNFYQIARSFFLSLTYIHLDPFCSFFYVNIEVLEVYEKRERERKSQQIQYNYCDKGNFNIY